jgi:hypothetical protein
MSRHFDAAITLTPPLFATLRCRCIAAIDTLSLSRFAAMPFAIFDDFRCHTPPSHAGDFQMPLKLPH